MMGDSSETFSTKSTSAKQQEKEPHSHIASFVVNPSNFHSKSVILLHGRGSNGYKFGSQFMKSTTSSGQALDEVFPGMRFIFPTAKKRRARWYKRAVISQWFDTVPIDEQDAGMTREEEERQLEGLEESRHFLQTIIDAEIAILGARNVFVGGLSQGCAMSLYLLLSYQPPDFKSDAHSSDTTASSLGGFIGMSGWLPFAKDIQGLIKSHDEEDSIGFEEDDFFATTDEENDDEQNSPSIATNVCNLVRDHMNLPLLDDAEPACLKTPVFMGHGELDHKVKMQKGRTAADVLEALGLQVVWKVYDEGHWYKVPDEIDDIVSFLQAQMYTG